MHTEYKPSARQIFEALKLLGCDIVFERETHPDGLPTEEDVPDLVGHLLAYAEITAENVVDDEDIGEVVDAFQWIFLEPPATQLGNKEVIRRQWEEFLIALASMADRLYALHHAAPELDKHPLDAHLFQAAIRSSALAGNLANMRLGLSLEQDENPIEPITPIEPELIGAAGLADELAKHLKEVADDPDRAAANDYDIVLENALDRLVDGGYIIRWDRQIDNGDAMVLEYTDHVSVRPYSQALDYVQGFQAAINMLQDEAQGLRDDLNKVIDVEGALERLQARVRKAQAEE